MKSIMEQASSVVKAIEKAWIAANKPKNFSVRIFEQEKKNFFGFTQQEAKIALFYEEGRVEKGQHQDGMVKKKHSVEAKNSDRVLRDDKQHEKKKSASIWTPEMIAESEQWLKSTLSFMGHDQSKFTVESKNWVLKIIFALPLYDDVEKEKKAFKSFAHLIVQILRNKFKKNLHGVKVIITSQSNQSK